MERGPLPRFDAASSTISMSNQLNRKQAYEAPAIPDRLYFKIGDVARLCGVETYVLRFWESQFPQLKPNKSGTGQRLYRRRDVEMALEIKRLVHAEGYTLLGARQTLEQAQRRPNGSHDAKNGVAVAADAGKRRDAVAAAIGHARAELRELAGLLSTPVRQAARPRGRVTAIAASGSLFPSESSAS